MAGKKRTTSYQRLNQKNTELLRKVRILCLEPDSEEAEFIRITERMKDDQRRSFTFGCRHSTDGSIRCGGLLQYTVEG